MINAYLQNIANDRGFIVDEGVAFGEVKGFTISLRDEFGGRFLTVAAEFDSAEAHGAFIKKLTKVRGKYRIMRITPCLTGFTLQLRAGVAYKKKLNRLLDELPELLKAAGAKGLELCAHCRKPITEDPMYVMAYIPCRIHKACFDDMKEKLSVSQDPDTSAPSKNTGRGIIGAFVGGIIGSIPWIAIRAMGWISGWLALVIAFAASYGFKLAGGKPGKAKVAVVVLATFICLLFAIAAGTVAVGAVELTKLGYTYTIPALVNFMYQSILNDSDIRGMVIRDAALGIFFAFICCFALFRSLNIEAKGGATAVKPLRWYEQKW